MTIAQTRAYLNDAKHSRSRVHDELAGVYMTLTRPISEEQRTEALAILHNAMVSLRELDANLSTADMGIKQVDHELLQLSATIRGIRQPEYGIKGTEDGSYKTYPVDESMVDQPYRTTGRV